MGKPYRNPDQLSKLIEAGSTIHEIAKMAGVKDLTVAKYATEFNSPIRPHKMLEIGTPLWRGYILHPPAIKKNSQTYGKAGSRSVMIKSPKYQVYELEAIRHLMQQEKPAKPIDREVIVVFRFYVPTRRRTDLSNLYEAPQDIMTKCGIILDDNDGIIVGHDFSRTAYDKKNPRTEIYIYDYHHFIESDIYHWMAYEKTNLHQRRKK